MLHLPSLASCHIVVVGDIMLDRYWQGPADRVSPEAPVPVISVEHTESRPGGAANVALNVVSLGARCTLVGLVGDDEAGDELRTTLQAAGVDCDFVVVDDWPTIVKLRLLAQKQQLVRADFEQALPDRGLSERLGQLQNKVEKHVAEAQALVIEDYDKGTIDDAQALIAAAKQAECPVLVDPKLKPLSAYAGATVVKPNDKEFAQAVATAIIAGEIEGAAARGRSGADGHAQAQALCTALNIEGLVVTRGGEGMEIHDASSSHHIPARSVEVYDVTGAGDTSVASLAIGTALGWSLVDAARLANTAASIVVSKSGTSPVTGPELAQALNVAPDRGLMDKDQLAQAVAVAKAAGERIVFTNGCFDILHAGHVTYLEEAAALGDRLVVAINDDDSVTRLKGPGRPVIPVEGRSRVLASLSCVDWVVSFDEDTPEPLLALLAPDVLVKGGDYGPDEVVGAQIVTDNGGEVRVLSLVEDVSTTAIVDRIRG